MHKTCTCISCFFLFFFGIPIAIALIFLLVIFPARFSISVEDAFVDAFHLANDGHLNSSFNLVIRSYDPSYTQNYQDVKVYILKENQVLVEDLYHFVNASYTSKNEARLSFRLVALNVPLEDAVVEDLRSESKKGVLKLSVNMRGILNMYGHVEVKCSNVMVNVASSSASSSSMKFRRRKCNSVKHGDLFNDYNY